MYVSVQELVVIPDVEVTSKARNCTRITAKKFSHGSGHRTAERTEDGIRFGVFFLRIHTYEGAKVVVGDLALISGKRRFDSHLIQETEIASDSRLNKLAPPLLSVSALHPFFVKLSQFLVGVHRQFWELFHGMFKDLIVNPDTGVRG